MKIFPLTYKFKQAYLAFALAGLKGAMQIVALHYSLVRRHAPSVGQFAVSVPLASTVAKDITACRHICCHCVVRRQGGFRALYKSNVDGRIGRASGAAVKHRDVVKGASVLFVEGLHPGGVRREKELFEGISQSRARLDLTEICRSGGQMMLAGHGSLRRLTLWDTAKT